MSSGSRGRQRTGMRSKDGETATLEDTAAVGPGGTDVDWTNFNNSPIGTIDVTGSVDKLILQNKSTTEKIEVRERAGLHRYDIEAGGSAEFDHFETSAASLNITSASGGAVFVVRVNGKFKSS